MIILSAMGSLLKGPLTSGFGVRQSQEIRENEDEHDRQQHHHQHHHFHLSGQNNYRHLKKKLSRKDPLTAPTIPVSPNWQRLVQSSREFTHYVVLSEQKPRPSILCIPLMNPLGVIPTLWGYWITIVDLTFTAIFVPLSLAFNYNMGNLVLSIFDMIGNVMYILDMIMNFHIGFVARSGLDTVVIVDGPASWKNYIRHGSFVIDLLATVPSIFQIILYIVIQDDNDGNEAVRTIINFMKLLRLARVMNLILRLGRFDQGGQVALFAATRLNALTLLGFNAAFSLLVCINVLACVWWWIAEIEGISNSWVAYMDKPLISLDLNAADYGAAVIARRWTICAYFVMVSMSTIGYGDITPQTIAEMYVAGFIVVVGVAWFAYLISTIALVLKSRKTSVDQEVIIDKMQNMEMWMNRYEFPKALKRKIRRHILSSWTPTYKFSEDSGIYGALPLELKLMSAKRMFKSDAAQAFIGKDKKDSFPPDTIATFMRELVRCSILESGERGEILYSVGDLATSCTLLQEGILAVSVPESPAPVLVHAPALLGVGALFGSFDLVPNCRKRHTTVTVFSNEVTYWKVNATSLEQNLALKVPKILIAILEYYEEQLIRSGDRLQAFKHSTAAKIILEEITEIVSGISELEKRIQASFFPDNLEDSVRTKDMTKSPTLDELEKGRIDSREIDNSMVKANGDNQNERETEDRSRDTSDSMTRVRSGLRQRRQHQVEESEVCDTTSSSPFSAGMLHSTSATIIDQKDDITYVV